MPTPRDLAFRLIRQSLERQDIELGRQVQLLMTHNALDSISVLADHIIRLFTSCKNLIDANQAFAIVLKPSQYTWNAIITAHAKLENGGLAFALYQSMQLEGTNPDKVTFLSLLKACTIEQARNIHEQIIGSPLQSDIAVGTTLIDMYAKSQNIEEAIQVFNRLPSRNVVTWNALIAGYAHCGEGLLALQNFENMQQDNIVASKVTFLTIIKTCTSIGILEQCRQIHEQIIESGLQSDIIIGSTLVDMYAKCASLEEAHRHFNQMQVQNVVTWGAMIAGYIYHDESISAMKCYSQMQFEGIKPDDVIFSSVLKACGNTGAIEQGRLIHNQIISSKAQPGVIVGSAMVDMYAKCESLEEARTVFDRLPKRNVITWNVMVAGYAQEGNEYSAIECFENMQQNGIKPNIETWGAMIGGYAQHKKGLLALECYQKMLQEKICPNKVALLNLLKACGSIGAIEQGRCIHEHVSQNGLQSDSVLGNALVDMYVKCGNLEEACKIFNGLPRQDLVARNSLIGGYSQLGDVKSAVQYFDQVKLGGLRLDDISFLGILSACSHGGLVDEGHWYYNLMGRCHGIRPGVSHITCMVDLLGGAGHFTEAEVLLGTVAPQDVCSWKSLLNACGVHGNADLGKQCFDKITALDSHCASAYVFMSNMYATGCKNAELQLEKYIISKSHFTNY